MSSAIELAAWLVLASGPAPAPPADMISAGEQAARRNCAECHAIGPGQASPLQDAPTFAALRARYDRAAMAAVIEDRMEVLHPRMPPLALDVDEVSEFLNWWDSLAPAKP